MSAPLFILLQVSRDRNKNRGWCSDHREWTWSSYCWMPKGGGRYWKTHEQHGNSEALNKLKAETLCELKNWEDNLLWFKARSFEISCSVTDATANRNRPKAPPNNKIACSQCSTQILLIMDTRTLYKRVLYWRGVKFTLFRYISSF